MSQSVGSFLAPIPLQSLDSRPLVSVLMANYNYSGFIGEAIESVLDQSYSDFEIIVCDDGSTDSSAEVVGNYGKQDNRVRLVQKENGGCASALNAAFNVARGAVICILDADDVYLPGKIIATIEAFHAHPECGIVTHRLRSVDARGRTLDKSTPELMEAGWMAPAMLQRGGHCWGPPASGLSIHRSVADSIFPIPLELRRMADGYVMRAAALCTKVFVIESTLARYRLHGANITGTIKMSTKALTRNLKDEHMVTSTVKSYIVRHYGPQAALSFHEEDLPTYWDRLLVATILHDPQLLGLYGSRTVAEGLAHMPPGRWLLYRGLLALPARRLRLKLLEFWWGRSVLKRFLRLFLPMISLWDRPTNGDGNVQA